MSGRGEADKPALTEYLSWLEEVWGGDNRELRPGRFMHQQADLRREFEASPYWRSIDHDIAGWSEDYARRTGHRLFAGDAATGTLSLKPWESFLNKTWRVNVKNNVNWPSEPPGGWILPDTWFERFWDVIRTRLTVRYLDGVKYLADCLAQQGARCGVDVHLESKAKETGYYAIHVLVPQEFTVQALDYGEPQPRRSVIEIQITTELQEMVGELTHRHFELDRTNDEINPEPWQWDYQRPEFSPYYLGHVLHWVEGVVMNLRDRGREEDDADA